MPWKEEGGEGRGGGWGEGKQKTMVGRGRAARAAASNSNVEKFLSSNPSISNLIDSKSIRIEGVLIRFDSIRIRRIRTSLFRNCTIRSTVTELNNHKLSIFTINTRIFFLNIEIALHCFKSSFSYTTPLRD